MAHNMLCATLCEDGFHEYAKQEANGHGSRDDDGVRQLRLDNCPDDQVWDEEIRLARIAADLGFDVLWSAEHHFNDYSFVPDNLHLMSYLAGVCPGMSFGTAAVILPWHDPLRVAENAAVLDLLCKGKLRLGDCQRVPSLYDDALVHEESAGSGLPCPLQEARTGEQDKVGGTCLLQRFHPGDGQVAVTLHRSSYHPGQFRQRPAHTLQQKRPVPWALACKGNPKPAI